jgi:hypothetical protein
VVVWSRNQQQHAHVHHRYPCLHVHVMKGEEQDQAHNLDVILRLLGRVSNIQVMVRLTIDRPFPELAVSHGQSASQSASQ